jgi:NitT/TauT family transport system ATP-binding protein
MNEQMDGVPAINFLAVGKRAPERPGIWLLQNVDLEVPPRQRLFLVGANGSGKSTLLRMMLGFECPDTGSVTIAPPLDGLSVSYVPQDYRNALFPWLTLSQNLSVALRANVRNEVSNHGLKEFERLAQLFQLKPQLGRYPYELSGGEQQLFLLIVALIRKPSLLVLDEPFSAIDFGRRELILSALGNILHNENCTFLAVTHDFEEAVLLANQVLVLSPDTAEIRETIDIPFEWPRMLSLRSSKVFREFIDKMIAASI